MSEVPQVDLNAPLPELEQPEVDTVMIKARREWYVGIGVFVVFVMVLGGVGWGYRQSQISNSQMANENTEKVTESPVASPSPVAEAKPVFAVWNGSGVAGAAGKMADKLKAEGYEVFETKNAPKEQIGTTIEMVSGLESQKEAILEIVGKAEVRVLSESGLEYSVKIIIGK